jgi:glucose/arabinose dehydrogenase
MGNRAQDLSDLAGKVIRITDEGQVPPDNPFVGQSHWSNLGGRTWPQGWR